VVGTGPAGAGIKQGARRGRLGDPSLVFEGNPGLGVQ